MLTTALIISVFFSFTSTLPVFKAEASPSSSYYYRFTVDREGATSVQINFSSNDAQGESWVFVPKNQSAWSHTEKGRIVTSSIVETDQVVSESYYFYRAFRFSYQAKDGVFNMTIQYILNNGAIIVEPRGIFYSPQIGFNNESSTGKAEVVFDSSFIVDSGKAIAAGAETDYAPTLTQSHLVKFNLKESVIRIQVEFSTAKYEPDYVLLKSSDNETFTFKSVERYQTYARDVLKLYDRIYANMTRLFNVTLSNVAVQWFLPEFDTLLAVGGFVPFTGEQLGEININIFFVRAVNGTVEVIAVHELVHRFLGKTGILPGGFLWLHEGMAQYFSIILTLNLGYEDASQEKSNLENGVAQVIQDLRGENFDSIGLQDWTPSYKPPTVDISYLYVASYHVVNQLPKNVKQDGVDYYSRFFKLIHGVRITDINDLSFYLSTVANASVALTLQRWGFTVTDLYDSPISETVKDAGKAVEQVNPVFQPYRALADYFYQQAMLSAERSEWDRAESLLQLAIIVATLAPLLTFLTLLALVVLLVYLLNRRARKPRPVVPSLPSEILQPPTV